MKEQDSSFFNQVSDIFGHAFFIFLGGSHTRGLLCEANQRLGGSIFLRDPTRVFLVTKTGRNSIVTEATQQNVPLS